MLLDTRDGDHYSRTDSASLLPPFDHGARNEVPVMGAQTLLWGILAPDDTRSTTDQSLLPGHKTAAWV